MQDDRRYGPLESEVFDFPGFYRALVVDSRDPRDIGRVKVRVIGVYSNEMDDKTVPNKNLPWAMPALGLYNSGGDNSRTKMSSPDNKELKDEKGFNQTGTGGIFTVPRVGSHVWIFFDHGNHMYPVYFAMAVNETDWITQKTYVKDKIDNKIEQIRTFREKFKPVNGTEGTDGTDWADGAHVNPRSSITSNGQKTPYTRNDNSSIPGNADKGETSIKGGDYPYKFLHIDNRDDNGEKTYNMERTQLRALGNFINLDVKPLFDKDKKGKPDRSKAPHKYDKDDKEDEVDEEDKRNVNRYITSLTTLGGTTIVIDNREEQENFYLIHKNYLFNIDEDGSVKEFCGQNGPEEKELMRDDEDKRGNKLPKKDVRSNKETGVTGNYKIHVLGNFVTYTKGNVFMQVDKNMQIDVNDSYGVRVKKGDFDIVVEGSEDKERDDESKMEDGKTKQYGDINIDVKKGNMEIHVKKNANIHVEDQCNLKVDGDLKAHVKKAMHLHVEGDYNEFIEGDKFTTVKGKVENRFEGAHVKTEITKGDEYKDVKKTSNLKVGSDSKITISGKNNIKASANFIKGALDVNGDITSTNVLTPQVNLNSHEHMYITPQHPAGPGMTSAKTPPGGYPIDPVDAVTGANQGAGTTPDQEDQNKPKDPPASSKTSKNKTLKAKRKHDKRDKKENVKSAKGVDPKSL